MRNPCFSHPATGPETLRPLSFHAQQLIGGSHVDGRRIQNAKKGLEFADIGYVLVSGQTAIAGRGDDLLKNDDVGRLFLGG